MKWVAIGGVCRLSAWPMVKCCERKHRAERPVSCGCIKLMWCVEGLMGCDGCGQLPWGSGWEGGSFGASGSMQLSVGCAGNAFERPCTVHHRLLLPSPHTHSKTNMDPLVLYALQCTPSFYSPPPRRRRSVVWQFLSLCAASPKCCELLLELAGEVPAAETPISASRDSQASSSSAISRSSGRSRRRHPVPRRGRRRGGENRQRSSSQGSHLSSSSSKPPQDQQQQHQQQREQQPPPSHG